MELVVVTNIKLFEQASSECSDYSQQEGAMEMRDEVLSSVGVQGMDTSEYQVSDLDDVELFRQNDQLDLEVVFRPSTAIPFSPSTFDDFEMGSMTENPILIAKEQDKENSCSNHISLPETNPSLVLMRSRPFGKIIAIVRDYVYSNLFE